MAELAAVWEQIAATAKQLATNERELAKMKIATPHIVAKINEIGDRLKAAEAAAAARIAEARAAGGAGGAGGGTRPAATRSAVSPVVTHIIPAVPVPARRRSSNGFNIPNNDEDDDHLDLEYLYRLYGGKDNLFEGKGAAKGGTRRTRRSPVHRNRIRRREIRKTKYRRPRSIVHNTGR
jgi:hypothetical protein